MTATFLYSCNPKISIYITINLSILGLIAKFCRVINLDYIFVWNIILSSLISETICGFWKNWGCLPHFFLSRCLAHGGGHVRGIEWGSRSCISIEIFGAPLERLICIEWGAVERGETRCVCENILSLFTTLHVPYLFAPMVGFDFDAVCCRNQGLLHGENWPKPS